MGDLPLTTTGGNQIVEITKIPTLSVSDIPFTENEFIIKVATTLFVNSNIPHGAALSNANTAVENAKALWKALKKYMPKN